MIGLLALVGGILLRFNPAWFNGASTIGLVLIIFGGIVLLLELITFIGVGSFFKAWWKRF